MRIEGFAALYNAMSEDMGFREILKPGCFDRAVHEGQDTLARAEHRTELLLGRVASGTLSLELRPEGLWYGCDLPETSAGVDYFRLISRSDVSKSSFAFRIDFETGEAWQVLPDGTLLREVLEVAELVDVACVCTPAYRQTSVSARDLDVSVGELLRGRSNGRAINREDERLRLQFDSGLALDAGMDRDMERLRLEYGQRGRRNAMATIDGEVEVAALACRGERVDHSKTLLRGLLKVGKRIRANGTTPGAPAAQVITESRCAREAIEEEIAADKRRLERA